MAEFMKAYLEYFSVDNFKMKSLRCFDLKTAAHWLSLGLNVTASFYDIKEKVFYYRSVEQIIIPESRLVLSNGKIYIVVGRYPYSLALESYLLTGFKLNDVFFPAKEHEAVSTLLAGKHSISAVLQLKDETFWEPEIKELDFKNQTIVTERGVTLNFNLNDSFIERNPCAGYMGP